MFRSLRDYIYDHRRPVTVVAGFLGGAYLVGRYVVDRLGEVREQVVQERAGVSTLEQPSTGYACSYGAQFLRGALYHFRRVCHQHLMQLLLGPPCA